MPAQHLGQSVIVTGASSGIGKSIAQRLGAAGYELWLVGRSVEGLNATAADIARAGGPNAHCEPLDIAKPGALAELVLRVGELHPHLFALINNAGIMHPESVMTGSPQRWRAMFDVNVLAPAEACRAAVQVMRRQGGPGHLINVSSVAAHWDTGGPYGASKRALEMISSTLRGELERDNIRITTVVPGGFATQLGRHFEPESFQRIAESMRSKGLEPGVNELTVGDPDHIARAVLYILEQPVSINIERIVIRPPVDTSY
ncbi:MAG: SDR family oxidoreductase [Steroidobacteraceae bacterium]